MANEIQVPMTREMALVVLSVIKEIRTERVYGPIAHGVSASQVHTTDAELAHLIALQNMIASRLEMARAEESAKRADALWQSREDRRMEGDG
jgi:hypothetical protein